MNYSNFNNIYMSIISESTDCNLEHEKINKQEELQKENLPNKSKNSKNEDTNIDELTEENIATIDEANEDSLNNNVDDSQVSEDEENDGWSEDVENLCDELTYQFDGFAYEIKNCVKGSFTDATNPSELADYLENLKSEIDNVINQLREM